MCIRTLLCVGSCARQATVIVAYKADTCVIYFAQLCGYVLIAEQFTTPHLLSHTLN